jgi:hypothetical protein
MEEMTGPSYSTLSILRRYTRSYPGVISSERSDYPHCSLGYSHSLREVVVMCLLVVSSCEVAQITVYAEGVRAVYGGNFVGDAQAEPVSSEGERANLDSWLRDDV